MSNSARMTPSTIPNSGPEIEDVPINLVIQIEQEGPTVVSNRYLFVIYSFLHNRSYTILKVDGSTSAGIQIVWWMRVHVFRIVIME